MPGRAIQETQCPPVCRATHLYSLTSPLSVTTSPTLAVLTTELLNTNRPSEVAGLSSGAVLRR